jgi:DNA modification methylase
MESPADEVQCWSLDRINPSPRNARTHSDAQVNQLANSMREWGVTTAILLDENGTIIAGHGRVLAARKLGLKKLPVMIARGWTTAKIRSYAITDNKLALNAGWNLDILRLEFVDLKAIGADLNLLGFADEELADILSPHNDGLTDPDAVPEPLAEAVTALGDVWRLGKHRLACGDCTAAETVASALNGMFPQLMVTDPPYGVDYDPSWRNRAGVSHSKRTGKVANDHRADWREAWAHFPGDVAYVWHGALHAAEVAESLTACGFSIRSQIIWAKERLVLGRGDYHWQHEPCWYAARGRGHWRGDRKQTTVWQISSREQDAQTVHGTQKPVECMRRPMENNSVPGQPIYEPFCGSGTALIAAELSGRVCCAIELNPIYVDVAIRRWQAFTGDVAVLERSGESFHVVAEQRGVTLVEAANGAAG